MYKSFETWIQKAKSLEGEREKAMVHHSNVRTRFCETDALGHVNNVSFFIYFEQARVDFFIDTGVIKDIDNWSFVAASVRCDFRKQAYVHQQLDVQTTVSRLGRSSLTLKHQIIDQLSGDLIAEGEDILVHFDFDLQQSTPLREDQIELLKPYVTTLESAHCD